MNVARKIISSQGFGYGDVQMSSPNLVVTHQYCFDELAIPNHLP
jgi:hypothetical protein